MFFLQNNCHAQVADNGCLQTFYNSYTGHSFGGTPMGAVELGNGDLLVGGINYPNAPIATNPFGYLTTVNKAGKVTSSKKIYYKNDGGVLNVIKMKDGGALTVSNASNGADYATSFSRFDQQMNLQWEKIFQPAGILNVTADDAGNIYFIALVGQLYLDQRLVYTKLAPDGQVVYRYAVTYNDPFMVYGLYGSMCLYNNMLYLAIECAKYPVYYTMMVCINPADGAVQWSRVLGSPDLGELDGFDQLFVADNRLFAKASLIRTNNTGIVLIEFNANGDILNTRKLSDPKLLFSAKFGVTTDGNLIASGTSPDYSTTPLTYLNYFVRLSPSLDIINSRRHISPERAAPRTIFGSSDGYLYEAGPIGNPLWAIEFYMRKMTPDGHIGDCPEDTMPFVISMPKITYTNLPLTRKVEPITASGLVRSELPSQVNLITQYCASKSPCDTFFLTGPSSICDSTAVTIRAYRREGCNARTDWQIDLSAMKIIGQTDTTIQVKFNRNGNTIVRASQFNGCKVRTDSVLLDVHIVPSGIDLGAGGTICTGTNILLHAQPNYASYLWEDGSRDSVRQINQPGKYYVTATSFCGITNTDTVIFQPGIAGNIGLGADRTKCNNDTVRLIAPEGYSSYQWTNSLNKDTITVRTVIANPPASATWFLQAGNGTACFALDSIHITVLHSAKPDLGDDTSFCQRDSIVLTTGNSYRDYLWNTGVRTPAITIKQAGTYWVAATSSNGCMSRDTLTVAAVFPVPVVSLDHDPDICAGDIKTLSVLPGYSYYVWNDGSTQSFLQVSSLGKYWVKVTDLHGCTTSDTAVISLLRTAPHNFLLPDTSICPYQDLRIIAKQTFNSYAWSSGEQVRSIEVKNAGSYILEVTDQFGCSGKDTMIVAVKNCSKGIYFPTGFSPNGDGKNDRYRPSVSGQLINYRLSIYNRFGQMIFSTTDYRQAWDGKTAGKLQDSGGYVWMSGWQFIDSPGESKKGVLMLIK